MTGQRTGQAAALVKAMRLEWNRAVSSACELSLALDPRIIALDRLFGDRHCMSLD